MLSSFPCMNLCRKQLCHIEVYIIGVQAPQVLWWSIIVFWNFEWRPIAPLQTNMRTLVCTIF